MLFRTALLGGLFLAGHASARLGAVLRPSEDIEDVLRRDADMVATLTRRLDSNLVERQAAPSTTPDSGDASRMDLVQWETQTKAACTNALNALNGLASNPSGLAVCYNLPFLDNSTGIFQAELRLYNISAPIDPWDGVTAPDVSMILSYLGATVQSMNATFIRRDGSLVQRQAGSSVAPVELKVLNYVGRINSTLMGSAMTQDAFKELLIPQIELVARNPRSNRDVSANLSSRDASFVNGFFSTQTDTPISAAQVSALARLAAEPFILPGVNLAFFPIGLVITSIWAGGFFLTVGLGTIGRIQFREHYRRRIKNEKARTMRTI